VGALEPVHSGHVEGELDKPPLRWFQGKITRAVFFTNSQHDTLLHLEEF
jgi:hypothetical protein